MVNPIRSHNVWRSPRTRGARDERQRLSRDRGDRRQRGLVGGSGAESVQTAARTIRDLRVAEATRFDVTIEDGKIASYRVRLDLSFKFESATRRAGDGVWSRTMLGLASS